MIGFAALVVTSFVAVKLEALRRRGPPAEILTEAKNLDLLTLSQRSPHKLVLPL